jgi:outer membrane protein
VLLFFSAPRPPLQADEKATVLTVQECVQTALASHPDIRAGREKVEVARAKITGARSSYYPQVTSLSNYYRYAYQSPSGGGSSSSGISGLSGTGISSELSAFISALASSASSSGSTSYYDYYTGTIAVSQLFYDFGRTNAGVTGAREGFMSAHYDLLSTEQDIALKAKQAFYEALAACQALQVKEEAVQQQAEHLDQARAFFTEGTKPEIEVTKSEVDLAKAKLDLIKARNTCAVNLEKLAHAMGVKDEQVYELKDDLAVKMTPLSLPAALEEAKKNRPELKKFDADIGGYKARKKAAQVQNLPAFTLQGSYNWQGQQFPLPYYYYYGMQVTFTLFDGYKAHSMVGDADGNVKVLTAQQDAKLQDIYLDVKQSYLDLQASIDAVEVSERSRDQAEENYNLARGRYESGVGSSIEFTDARVSLTGARSDYITALTSYKVARVKLEKAMGSVINE